MSQSTDVILSPNISGTAQRTELNDILQALLTGHSGASRPGYLTGRTGGWTKIVSGTVHELYYFDGTDDILMGTVNFSTNTFTPSGSTVAFGNAVDNKTAAYTMVDGDCGKIITADATASAFSLAIDPTSGLRSGWYVIVQKTDATANAVTIDPDSTDTINGVTTFALSKQRDAVLIVRATASTFIAVPMPNTANVARLDGAAFTVSPTMPTPSGGDNTTKGATTAFVTAALSAALASYAPLNSPALTGNPTAPTPSPGDNDTSIATTAFVAAAVGTGTVKAVKRQVFTASGTYTPSTGMLYCVIEAIGGGGGSAASVASVGGAGGGGGGGGYAAGVFTAATIGASVGVTVGAGGAGGVGSGNLGGAGGTTSVGAPIIQATGGASGNAVSTGYSAGGVGGIGTVGSVLAAGSPGHVGGQNTGANTGFSGNGGSSVYGAGGVGRCLSSGIGNSGRAYGGGAGGTSSGGGGYLFGAAGAAGVVIVTEYCSQ